MEDLDAETGVEPVNDGFADRSLNRLGTPRFAYDEDATPNRGMGIVSFRTVGGFQGGHPMHGVLLYGGLIRFVLPTGLEPVTSSV